MRGIFDDEERKPSRAKGDTELTLGLWTLLGIFFGLVVVCGLCFGMGYALGSRSDSKGPVFQSQPPAAGPATQTPANTPQNKPSAEAQPPQAPQAMDGTQQAASTVAGAAPGTVPGTASGTAAGGVSGTAPGAVAGTTTASNSAPGSSIMGTGTSTFTPNNSGWQRVPNTGQPSTTGPAQTTLPATAASVRPAMSRTGTIMVQIAAVSNQADANVLLSALRRRGYAASAIHFPADNLIHVCIGPFNNRNAANSMREKLLGDGYNAIVLQ